MRKLTALTIALIIILLSFSLAGCDKSFVRVDSALNITNDFSGSRNITVVFPLDAKIDELKDAILEENPCDDIKGASFEYMGIEEDGYYFSLNLSFASKKEYLEEINALIAREADVFLSKVNSPLTKGVRMSEDFDVADIISWIVRLSKSDPSASKLEFKYTNNAVSINNEVFTSGSTIDIDSRKGFCVNSITVETTNFKDKKYGRSFTFSFPNETYQSNKDDIEAYFLSNTSSSCSYYGWSSKGQNTEYSVIYENITLNELEEFTSMLLDTQNTEIFYGDRDNSSTPLSEGLTFDEKFDTYSFIGSDAPSPKLSYKYALPTKTIHGDGSLKIDGNYSTFGYWEDGVYIMNTDASAVSLRIPDGIQYSINGINFTTESLPQKRFKRTTQFLYSKTDGYDGLKYAMNFFKTKGANAEESEDDSNLLLSVTCEGTVNEINEKLIRLFGSGNYLTYDERQSALSLSSKTKFIDYINLGYMLNSTNSNRPMTYTVFSSSEENITSLSNDAQVMYTKSNAEKLKVDIEKGNATVEYNGNVPIVSHIIIYSVLGAFLLAITVFVCIMLMRHNKKKETQALPLPQKTKVYGNEAQNDDTQSDLSASQVTQLQATQLQEPQFQATQLQAAQPSLAQTTTFSLSELGVLSDKKNKKYIDEINKDIEEKLEAERLENLKKELKAKEIEEMGRKIYGTSDPGESEPVDENSKSE